MIRALALALITLAAACNHMTSAPAALASPQAEAYGNADFARLGFLQGRWTGIGPDGKPFYEQYAFIEVIGLVSERYDATFTTPGETSTVSLQNGDIISRWDDYTWKAAEVRDGYIAFAPVNAPSSFSWRRINADTVEVLQKWTGADGKPQSYTITLRRVG